MRKALRLIIIALILTSLCSCDPVFTIYLVNDTDSKVCYGSWSSESFSLHKGKENWKDSLDCIKKGDSIEIGESIGKLREYQINYVIGDWLYIKREREDALLNSESTIYDFINKAIVYRSDKAAILCSGLEF